MVDSYQDITSAGLPLDGTPVMFMLNSSPQLYIAYMQGEKKYICGYKIESMDIEKESPAKVETPPPHETLALAKVWRLFLYLFSTREAQELLPLLMLSLKSYEVSLNDHRA